MLGFLMPKEDTLEDIEAQIEAKHMILRCIGKASINDLQTLEKLYCKQIILKKQQQAKN